MSSTPGRPPYPATGVPPRGEERGTPDNDDFQTPVTDQYPNPIVKRQRFNAHEYAGIEWVVDAFGCTPEACCSVATLGRIIEQLVDDLNLHPVRPPVWQTFEGGGVTGMVLLSESHVTCHSFPELGFVAFNLYCCRQRQPWRWDDQLSEYLGASHVVVRELVRG